VTLIPHLLVTLAASSRSGVRPSVCHVGILTVTHQGAACDATSVYFGSTIRRTDIHVTPSFSTGATATVLTAVCLFVCLFVNRSEITHKLSVDFYAIWKIVKMWTREAKCKAMTRVGN